MTYSAPRVSVVMPTFNQASFLPEAVRSVMAQASEGGLELVVVDGASTDGTVSLLAQLAEEFPGRLRWSSAPDAGPASAVNAAVRQARGEMVGWLNSDDYYLPGAVAQAQAAFQREPGVVMVYGEGLHVDVNGKSLGAYPTLPPSTPLDCFRDGCFICQPTVFFKRDVFLALGGLDESLGAAFDFDLWLRFFKQGASRIRHVPFVLAASRLHADGITLRLRERVAKEGILVLARYFGSAPAHWLLTHLEELLAEHPFTKDVRDLRSHFSALIEREAQLIDVDGVEVLRSRFVQDQRLALTDPHLMVQGHADGWTSDRFELRVRQPGQRPYGALRFQAAYAWPDRGPLTISVSMPSGRVEHYVCDQPGQFELMLPLDDPRPLARQVLIVHVEPPFVPADWEAGSNDRRSLGLRWLGLEGVIAP